MMSQLQAERGLKGEEENFLVDLHLLHGRLFYAMHDRENALMNFHVALAKAVALKNMNGIARAQNEIGGFHVAIGRTAEAVGRL